MYEQKNAQIIAHFSLFVTEPKKPSKVVQIEVDDSDIKGMHTQSTSLPIRAVVTATHMVATLVRYCVMCAHQYSCLQVTIWIHLV